MEEKKRRGRPPKVKLESSDILIPDNGSELINQFVEQYSSSLRQQITQINELNQKGFYQPSIGQDFTQSINISPNVPTQKQLTEWLRNPQRYQKQLRDTSQFLENSIMQYERSIKHFASLMTFKYDLRPCDRMPKDEKERATYLNSMDTCMNILKQLNIRYQFEKVNWGIMQSGAKFYYIRETDRFKTLQELPSDFCYITGTWDLGYTFAIDLTFFDKMVNAKLFAPEICAAYDFFIKMRELGMSGSQLAPYQYYGVPIEKGWVFTFDPVHAQAVPPLKGVMKDALEILSYKDLLKQKTTLDTWKLIAQKIPYDEKNQKFIVEYKEAQNIVNMIQQMMPSGARTFATFFEPQEINFSQAQSMNNISGLGESLYWQSIGLAGGLFGGDNKTSMGLKLSIETDNGFIDHLYRQYENFVNWLLLMDSRAYTWQVKFYGDRFTENEDIATYQTLVTANNFPVGKLFGLAGYEPFEVLPILDLENELGIKDMMKPIIAGSQMSGTDVLNKGGKPVQAEVDDAGQVTRDNDSNANK